MTPQSALACWERALEEEIGIILTLAKMEDKASIEVILYKARQSSGNPDLQALSLLKPGDNPLEIWIIKKTTDMTDVQ